MPEAADPQFSRYSNRDLEAFLVDPKLNEDQKSRMRQELTRRMRDDLIKSAQTADRLPLQQRRKRAWRLSRLTILLIVLLICALTALCAVYLPKTDWYHRLFGLSLLILMV